MQQSILTSQANLLTDLMVLEPPLQMAGNGARITHPLNAHKLAADIILHGYNLRGCFACVLKNRNTLKMRDALLRNSKGQCLIGSKAGLNLMNRPVTVNKRRCKMSMFGPFGHHAARAMPHFGPTGLLSIWTTPEGVDQNGSQFNNICAADEEDRVWQHHVLDRSGTGPRHGERRAQLFAQNRTQNHNAIDAETHQPVHVASGAGRRRRERECGPLDRLYLSGHRAGVRGAKGCGRGVDHRLRADRAQPCDGDQHRRNVCAGPAIKVDCATANRGFPWRAAVRGRSGGAGARSLRPFLSAVVDRRHDGEREPADLTPKFTFNLTQRAAVSRILCSAMERE
jgi:hypothetical protein